MVFRHDAGGGLKLKPLADMTTTLTATYPVIEKATKFWDALALVNLISDTNWFLFPPSSVRTNTEKKL